MLILSVVLVTFRRSLADALLLHAPFEAHTEVLLTVTRANRNYEAERLYDAFMGLIMIISDVE